MTLINPPMLFLFHMVAWKHPDRMRPFLESRGGTRTGEAIPAELDRSTPGRKHWGGHAVLLQSKCQSAPQHWSGSQ